MKIKIISVEIETLEKYNKLEVTYKNLESGKTESRKLVSFKYPTVYNAVAQATPGSQLNIQAIKGEKFWEWTDILDPDAAPPETVSKLETTTKVNTAPKSTYETPEERAKKQIYIVRQSSISSAIDLLKTEKKQPNVTEVLEVAAQFENYVFGVPQEVVTSTLPVMDTLSDDIPY